MAKGAKQRWNEKNYTPIKVSVRHNIASSFKLACLKKGESQASVLAKAMIEYADIKASPQNENAMPNLANDGNKYNTRRKRRKITEDIINQLNQVLKDEEEYMNGIPCNFVNRSATAEETIELLTEAINNLKEAYLIT